MAQEFDVWAVMARYPDGRAVVTACGTSEEHAYNIAQEAVDMATLALSHGAPMEQIEHAECVFNSIRVLPARIILDEPYE